jgi:hypothetical protein
MQWFTAVVPSWILFWRELALRLCFAIDCIDARVLSHIVRSLMFPTLRRCLAFLRTSVELATPADPPSGASDT